MMKKSVAGIAVLLMCLGCASSRASQVSSLCPHIQLCLLNQEAATSDPAGIYKYDRDLVDLVLPNQWTYGRSPSGKAEEFEHEFLGDDYAAKLADRLSQAEQAARTGNGRLVPEASVVKAFNDLMQGIGAPPSVRAHTLSVHEFREHAASIKAFPALFSADRNGTNCNPGEAMFLLYLLIYNDGHPSERLLDWSAAMEQGGSQSLAQGLFTSGVPRPKKDARNMISDYSSQHQRSANIRLFDRVVRALGFQERGGA
jgi:hypothetical protein